LLQALITAAGPADRAIAALNGLALPPAAAAERDRLAQVVALVQIEAPDVTLTVDPVENRGFEYHTGVSFALFARSSSGELGRGGRYLAGGTEPATGATLFMDTVLAALPGPQPARRIFLPFGTPRSWAQALRAQGWITIAGLDAAANAATEGRRLGCGHRFADQGVVEIDG
ncbi:MAG: ATP phosphoribosyltransferase regulatory subunit, partial [Magnetospirillum sp.]|nr:ATP phosphoribosyltransferase regulatory subunit [Magnetospirillum sp.]